MADPVVAPALSRSVEAQKEIEWGEGLKPDTLKQARERQAEFRPDGVSDDREFLDQAAKRAASVHKITAVPVVPEYKPSTVTVTPDTPDPGKVSQNQVDHIAKELYAAMDGMGTDEMRLIKALENHSPEDIVKIEQTYRDLFGKDLRRDIAGELSGEYLERANALLEANQPLADAIGLHMAMKGMGTDNEELFRILDRKGPEHLAQVQQAFAEKYGEPLDKWLEGDLSGRDLERARNLLTGKGSEAAADELHRAMAGMGTDENAIFETLRDRTPEEIAAIKEAFRKKYGGDLEVWLKDDLGKSDMDRATALLTGNKAIIDASKLHEMVDGMGTDEKGILELLKSRTPQEIEAIKAAYKERYKEDMGDRLVSEMNGILDSNSKLKELEALLTPTAEKKATLLYQAMFGGVVGWGTDEEAFQNVWRNTTEAERKAITEAYNKAYAKGDPQGLEKAVKSEFSGDELERALGAMKTSAEPPAVALHRAMAGIGTDEELLIATLRGRTKAEIAEIEKDYKARYGKDLRAEIDSELSGKDKATAVMLLDPAR